RNGSLDVFGVARQGHADRLDLIDGGVRGISAATERVEEHFSAQGSLQTVGESGIADPVSHPLTSNDVNPFVCRRIRSPLAGLRTPSGGQAGQSEILLDCIQNIPKDADRKS